MKLSYSFFRLTPCYAILIGISATLVTYTGNGPQWWLGGIDVGEEYCKKNWWTNLLYINNLVNTDEMVYNPYAQIRTQITRQFVLITYIYNIINNYMKLFA